VNHQAFPKLALQVLVNSLRSFWSRCFRHNVKEKLFFQQWLQHWPDVLQHPRLTFRIRVDTIGLHE